MRNLYRGILGCSTVGKDTGEKSCFSERAVRAKKLVKSGKGLRKRCLCLASALALVCGGTVLLSAAEVSAEEEQTVTLRVCNWEEYMDQGDWDEDEVIDLESGDIIGENSMVEDFEDWYYETTASVFMWNIPLSVQMRISTIR